MVALAALVAAISSPSQALAAAPLTWSAPATVPSLTLNGIACPSRGLCVAVDGEGHVMASAAPTSGGSSSWRRVYSGSTQIEAVACASSALCIAVDNGGHAIATTAPATVGSWTSRPIDGTNALTSISCPSESLCVAVDKLGNAVTSTTPAASSQSWRSAAIDQSQALRSVSCSSAQLCVAVDEAGTALSSEQPTVQAAWHKRDIDSPRALLGVSCDTASICVAVDETGNVLASADPTSSTPTWSSTAIDPAATGGAGARAGVSCVSSTLCVAVDGSEAALASDDPTDPTPVWSDSHAGVPLAGISCAPEGFCVALSGGRVVTAALPAPVAVTDAPTEVGQTTATLSGTANPNDVPLSDCRFEYGTSAAYGQSAPCSALDHTSSAPQPIAASLTGLTPGTLYHYRLVALTGAGEGVGADQTFTTVTATLVHPHPSISGVPAVGSRLICDPGITAGESVRLTYEWRRDGSAIEDAHALAYRVTRADATHHVQCLVTATNAAGSATGHSAFVAIPAQGVVAAANETVVGRASAKGGRVSVPIRCSPRASKGCTIALRLTILLRDRHRRLVSVAVGSSSVRLAPGQRRVVSVALDARGRRLLAHAKRLSVQLSATGTIIGVLSASLSRQRLTLSQPSRRRRR